MIFTGREATEQGTFDILECEHCGHSPVTRAEHLKNVRLSDVPCNKCGMTSRIAEA